MDKIEIPRKLKGKELTNFLIEKLDELADNICQDPRTTIRVCQKME